MAIKLEKLEVTNRIGGSMFPNGLIPLNDYENSREQKHRARLVVVSNASKDEALEILAMLGLLDGLE